MRFCPKPRLGLHTSYLEFLGRLEPQWIKDDVLMTLMFAVVLFSADNLPSPNIGQARSVRDACA